MTYNRGKEVVIVTEQEKKELLEREEEQYKLTESLVRSLLKRPLPTKAELEAHMDACRMYLEAGHPYDGERTPFVIGFKEERG